MCELQTDVEVTYGFGSSDTDAEIALVIELAKEAGAYDAVECTHWADGGKSTCFYNMQIQEAKSRSFPSANKPSESTYAFIILFLECCGFL